MKRIVLTGGGTAGHVTPNIALIPRLKKLGYEISYIGSYEGIEKKLISDYDIPYYGVSEELIGSVPRCKGACRSQKNLKGYPSGRDFFQRRLRFGSRGTCGRRITHPLHHS